MSLLDKNNNGSTALIFTSENGHESIVSALLAAGASIEGNWVGSLFIIIIIEKAVYVLLFIYTDSCTVPNIYILVYSVCYNGYVMTILSNASPHITVI
jgi:ankyrin repeat protein